MKTEHAECRAGIARWAMNLAKRDAAPVKRDYWPILAGVAAVRSIAGVLIRSLIVVPAGLN